VRIDALDPDAWNGVVFIAKAFGQRSTFALRFGSRSGGSFINGPEIYDAIREVGPHAPDASYCRLAWYLYPRQVLVTLEWSRTDAVTVVGRITAHKDFQHTLEAYIPFDKGSGVFSIDGSKRAIEIERHYDGVFAAAGRFVVMIDRPALGNGTYPSLEQLRDTIKGVGILTPSNDHNPARDAAGLQFTTDDSQTAHFAAVLGWDREKLLAQAQSLLASGKIDSILKEKSEAYERRRPRIQGLFEGAAQAIGNNMFWNSLYAPQTDLIFPSISRKWARGFGGWVIGEWDGFFGSLLSALEDKNQTLATIRALGLSQTETGLIPNVISGSGVTPDRSQPPVGAYCFWKVYQRYQDRELLEWTYPRLKRWHEWWFQDRGDGQPMRDGNRDGLLEWGSDRGTRETVGGRGFLTQAKWESGMDDSPMYDDAHYDTRTYTMDLDDVGLNSLYALDAECLAKLAQALGKEEDRKVFQAQYEKMKLLIREKLWNETDGIYQNLSWNGQFSKRLSPTNFYPMLAGIATPDQAQKMVRRHLLNTDEFWGEYVAPTIARNDPAHSDQFYWRGVIWGPTNYLLYHAIDRYGFDQAAFDFAKKSYNLFMGDWKGAQHSNEQYYVWGGNGGGDTHYTWGALLPLIASEQFLDENPWDGLRFGALNPDSQGHFRGAMWKNHIYDVTIGPDKTELVRDGKTRFLADAGVVVRSYEVSPAGLSLQVHSERDFRMTTGEFDVGFLNLKIDGKATEQVKVIDGKAGFAVPQGRHTVEATR